MSDSSGAIRLIPNVPNCDSKLLYSFDDLVPLLDQMSRRHSEYVNNNKAHWEEEMENIVDIGFSFSLLKGSDNAALIGVGNLGWVLYRMRPKPIKCLESQGHDGRLVAFLLPEWSEFVEGELTPRDDVLQRIRTWFASPIEDPVL